MRLFLLKSLLLALIIAGLQILLAYSLPGTRFTTTFPKLDDLNRFLEERRDIIYLGGSAVRWSAPEDKDKTPIFEYLERDLPGMTVGPVDDPAYHLELYESFVRYILRQEHRPEFLVMPINVRSFSPEWHMRPEYQFVKYHAALSLSDSWLLRPFYKPLMVFKVYNLSPVSHREFLRTPVYDGEERIGFVRDFIGQNYRQYTEAKLRDKVQFHYMYRLAPDHPKLLALARIAGLLNDSGIKTVFYTNPVDFETCEAAVPGFRRRVEENLVLVRDVLAERGFSLLDLTFGLPARAFNWREMNYPNEHVNEIGKAYTAEKIAAEIRRLQAEQ